MPSQKREAARMLGLSALAAAQPEEIRTRRTAAEATYSNIVNRLGAAGTYENVGGEPGGPTAPATEGPSLFKTEKAKGGHATDIDRRYQGEGSIQDITRLDPEAAANAALGSTQGRIMSRLTAESEQLLARKGPLYDEMLNNLQLPIIEGSAAVARENAESLKRAFARGGAARRTAFETVQKIRDRERVNSDKIQKLSQVRFGLDQWARENARTNLEFGQAWASNVGGVRESFNSAMDQASQLMLTSALPIMAETTAAAASFRQQAHQQKRDKLGRWINGVMGIGMAFAGAGMGGMLGQTVQGALGGGKDKEGNYKNEKYGPGLVGAGFGLLGRAVGG